MESLLHEGLRASAERFPDRVAIVDGERKLSYADLEARANRVARLLLDLGVTKGDRVGLYLNKSIESVVAIYGILKAGAAYVPLDPQAPESRLAYIGQNCGIRCLITSAGKVGVAPELIRLGAPHRYLVVMDSDSPAVDVPSNVRVVSVGEIDSRESTPPKVAVNALSLGYILYTSGSTGAPKGVMLSHLNGMAFVEWAVDEFGVNADDRLSSHAPLHFDLSIFDFFAASRAGASVTLVPPEASYFPVQITRLIDECEITIWYSVPSILNLILVRGNLKPGAFPHLRAILFAGEVFPTKYLRQLMSLLPHTRFSNLYGPTETNVCTWYDVAPIPDDQNEPIPIGRPITGTKAFAVTDEGRVAQPGESGELFVSGPTVMQGYWADAERTAETLQFSSLVDPVGSIAYRTGDVVVLQDDGNYHLLGRRDHQIKSRGYRIELGDIESALYGHPSVIECAVAAIPDELVTNRLRAFVVARDGTSQSDLTRFCATQLPHYMVPEKFELRDELPKTSTGKVDRQALQDSLSTTSKETP